MTRPIHALILAAALALAACQPGTGSAPDSAPTTPAAQPAPVTAPTPDDHVQVSVPEGPAMAPVQVPETASCRTEIGETASARLVQRCIQVSPATHPPCNAQNACALIQHEIDRSCALWGPDETKPAECAA